MVVLYSISFLEKRQGFKRSWVEMIELSSFNSHNTTLRRSTLYNSQSVELIIFRSDRISLLESEYMCTCVYGNCTHNDDVGYGLLLVLSSYTVITKLYILWRTKSLKMQILIQQTNLHVKLITIIVNILYQHKSFTKS